MELSKTNIANVCRILGIACMGLLLASVSAHADSSEIEHECTVRYPSITQYFAWKDCVKTQTEYEEKEAFKRQLEDQKRSREEEARPCIAADIPRMEALASKVKDVVLPEASLEQTQAAIELVLGYRANIQIADENIRERVLVTSIRTKCGTDFHLLINVREGQDKKLRYLIIAAQNPPAGYRFNSSEFGKDFEAERERQQRRDQEAKFQEDFKAKQAEDQRKTREARREFLRSVKITDAKIICSTGPSCSIRTIEFKVTNVSQQPIREISFGWMILPSKAAECPAEIATNEQDVISVLQPGQTQTKKFYSFLELEGSEAKLCLRATDFRSSFPWEH